MKVYVCQRQGSYSGGLAIVAANNKEEAIRTFFEDSNYDWMVLKCDKKLKPTDDFTQWSSIYYPIEKWYLCKELTANVDKPCVIMEGGYTE